CESSKSVPMIYKPQNRATVMLSGTPRSIWPRQFKPDPSRSTAQDDNSAAPGRWEIAVYHLRAIALLRMDQQIQRHDRLALGSIEYVNAKHAGADFFCGRITDQVRAPGLTGIFGKQSRRPHWNRADRP